MEVFKIWLARIIRSKTMHAANIVAIIGIIQTNSDFLSTVLTPKQFGWVMIGISVAMIFLRTKTTNALEDK